MITRTEYEKKACDLMTQIIADLWESNQIRKKAEELSAWLDSLQYGDFSRVLEEMESLANMTDDYHEKCAYVNLLTGESGWRMKSDLDDACFLVYQHSEDSNFLEAGARSAKPEAWQVEELSLLDATWYDAEAACRAMALAEEED